MIKLLIAGSPCTNWSIAKNGRETEPIGAGWELFKNYLIAKEKFRPDFFLYENNKSAAKAIKKQIAKELGVGKDPHTRFTYINSALVSAQNRERFYVTNFGDIEQPEDRGILLKDIVFDDVDPVVLHNLYGGFKEKAVRVFENKSPTIRTSAGGGHIPSFVKKGLLHSEKAIEYMNRKIRDGRTHWDFGHHSDIENPKSSAVVANFFKGVPYNVFKDWGCIRKFHPIECERLQTLPDNYTSGISDTQRYKCIGNGWTAEIIIHLLYHALKDVPRDTEIAVLSLYDGIGTGRYCLDKMGFTNVKYHAYEIDKYAIQVANNNYPDIIQYGDAFQVREKGWKAPYTPKTNLFDWLDDLLEGGT